MFLQQPRVFRLSVSCTVPSDSPSDQSYVWEEGAFFWPWVPSGWTHLSVTCASVFTSGHLVSVLGLDGRWMPKHPRLFLCNRASARLLLDVPPNAPGCGGLAGLAGLLGDISLRVSWRCSREALPFGASPSLQEVPAGLAVAATGLLTRLYSGRKDLGWIMWIPPMGIRRLGALLGCWECRGRWLRRLWAPRGLAGCKVMWVGPTSSTDWEQNKKKWNLNGSARKLGHYTGKMMRIQERQNANEADLNAMRCGSHNRNYWCCQSGAIAHRFLSSRESEVLWGSDQPKDT